MDAPIICGKYKVDFMSSKKIRECQINLIEFSSFYIVGKGKISKDISRRTQGKTNHFFTEHNKYTKVDVPDNKTEKRRENTRSLVIKSCEKAVRKRWRSYLK